MISDFMSFEHLYDFVLVIQLKAWYSAVFFNRSSAAAVPLRRWI